MPVCVIASLPPPPTVPGEHKLLASPISASLGTGDALLVLVLAVTSVLPVLVIGDPSWGRPKALGVVLALASTVPVACGARYPLSAFAVVLAANAACLYAAAPREAAFQPFVALTLTAYSVGSRAEARRALWAPPLLVVAMTPVFVAARLHGQHSGNIIPSFVWLVAAWATGRTVRSWRHKNLALERANRELAAQRELQAQAAVAVERGRIARELHDVVAHNVSMMVVQAGAAARVLHGEQPDVQNALEVIAATGRETVDEMRTLLGVLRSGEGPASLKPQPGLADLEQLVSGIREAGLPVTLAIEGAPRPLPPALDLATTRHHVHPAAPPHLPPPPGNPASPHQAPSRPGPPANWARRWRTSPAGQAPPCTPIPGPAPRAPKLRTAVRHAAKAGHAYVVVDGTLIPIDRLAADRPFYSGKHRRRGMNLQVIAGPACDILWVSGPLPGSVHDKKAEWIWGVLAELEAASLIVLADKGYQGAEHAIIPHKGRNKPHPRRRQPRARETPRPRRTCLAALGMLGRRG